MRHCRVDVVPSSVIRTPHKPDPIAAQKNDVTVPVATKYHPFVVGTHLQSVFGDDWFALKAEAFARFLARRAFSSPRPSLLPFGFSSMSWGLQHSTSIRSSSSTSPSACKQRTRLHSYYSPKPARLTATRLTPEPMPNIERPCIKRARNGKR